MRTLFSTLTALFAVVAFAACTSEESQSTTTAADTIFTNAKVYTVDESQPWAEAVAVKANEIVYVGDAAGAEAFIGSNTEVLDLGSRLVLPGLVSGHEHPLVMAAFAAALQIEYTEDAQKMLDALAQYIEARPEAARMSWGGSYEGRVDITREDIDEITNEPFVMIAASGHGAWMNTAALEAAGITKGAEIPVDGYEVDENGAPTGYASTSAAAMYAVIQLDLIKREDVLANLPGILEMFNSYGFTATYDAGTPPGAEPVFFAAAHDLERQGKLTVRISGSIIAQRPVHLPGAYELMQSEPRKYTSELFKVDTVKLHGGAPDGHSSPLLEPYSDRPDYSGPVIFPYDLRVEATMKAVDMGFNVHTHVIGDKAVREALDSFAEVRAAGHDDVRLTTGHSSMVHPDDQPRYAELNVTHNMYGTKNTVSDEVTLSRIGQERLKYWHPAQTLAQLGTRISMSADAPTAPLDPWQQIEVVMLRREPGMTEALFPEEGLTIEQAIEAYTMGAGYQLGWEDMIGSLEVGKRADLIVVSQNLFEIDAAEIHESKAVLTMLDGNVVHREGI